jgi:hypothetical protein
MFIENIYQKKLRIFNELELPLLVKSGFINANANFNAVTTNCNTISRINSSNIEIYAQNLMGRKGFEPSNPAMSRRYLNQARPPARYCGQTLIVCYNQTFTHFILAIIKVII